MGWFAPEMSVRVSWPQAVQYARSRPGFRLGLALFWCLTRGVPYAPVTGYVARPRDRFPEVTEPDAQLVPPGVGGRTAGAETVHRILSGRRPLSLLLRLPGPTWLAATWVCFHPRRIWVGSRWRGEPVGRAIGYGWDDRDHRLAAAFAEAGHPLPLNESGVPVVLDRHGFRSAGCGPLYPGPDLFDARPAGPVLGRSLRESVHRGAPTARAPASRPATAYEEIAWAFADELRGRHPRLGVAVHSPSLVARVSELTGRLPDFPPVLVLWDPVRGRGVARLEFGRDGITARGDTGGTARCGYDGPDAFDTIDAFLAGRVPSSGAVSGAQVADV